MHCSKCGADAPSGAKFCAQCGERLTFKVNPDQAPEKKVDGFLAPSSETLLSQTEPYERRVVTVLFADIVGFTSFSELIDPEELTEIMRCVYPCLLEPIHAYQGSVVQVMGDGVLAYFGAPVAHEDDAERAILSGLEIVNRVRINAKKLKEEKGIDNIQVRVGINTGLVVVGEMNPEKFLDYIALGDTVNLADRLQKNAPGNGVLINHTTYQQVRGLFITEKQAPIQVKGREQIEQTYLVKARKPDHLQTHKRGFEEVATSMIGRESETVLLKNTFTEAFQGGKPAFVFVSGEPGIGKTRLINEFVSWVKAQPNTPILLQGRAIKGTQDVPFGVLRNLFARHFGILGTDSSAEALAKFRTGTQDYLDREQSDLIGQFVGFDFKDSPVIQQLFGTPSFSRMAALYLENYFRILVETSLLIIIEDLHWIDNRTLELLSDLLNEFARSVAKHVMILCTGRTEFFEIHPNWGEGVQGFYRINLRKLSHSQSKALINEILLTGEDIPEAFYDCVVGEAGGNPFFIEEILRMFLDEGVIETKQGATYIKLEELERIHVPPTLNGILQARLDSLPLAERQVLQRAAIIGRTFWDGLIRSLTIEPVEKKEIQLHLNALRERGLIFKIERSSIAANQEYQFKHALLRDESYETVLLKHRRNYHKRVAVWIAENAGDRLEEHLILIANHYSESGEKALAADWFIKAGQRALVNNAMREAVELFGKALNLISEDDLSRMWKATLGHDEAVGALGEADARHADDEALLRLAKQLDNDKFLAEAYYRIGSQAYSEGKNQDALQAFDQALYFAVRANYLTLQAEILPLKIVVLTVVEALDAAGAEIDRALTLARQTGNANIYARALTNVALYYEVIGNISKSMHLMAQQIEINQQQGNLLGETFGLLNLGYFYLSLGRFKEGYDLLDRALKNAQRLGARNCEAYSLLNLGLAEWRLGRWREACKLLESSLGVLKTIGDQRGLASREFYLGLSHESGGDFNLAADYFRQALVSFEAIGAKSGIVEAQAGLARLAHKQGSAAEAGELALEVINFLDKEGNQGLELPVLAYLTCIKIFDTLGDTVGVEHVRKEAYSVIQDRLAMIDEPDWRKVYLESIPENRELVKIKKEVPKY